MTFTKLPKFIATMSGTITKKGIKEGSDTKHYEGS